MTKFSSLLAMGVGVPIRVRDDVAVLAMALRTALDEEFHQLRRGQLPGILGT